MRALNSMRSLCAAGWCALGCCFSAPAWADIDAGRAAYARWEFSQARNEFAVAAGAGNVDAMVLLAEMAADGIGGEKDERAAFVWFLKAAEEGHRKSQSETARRYSLGLGTTKDDANSLYWTRIAADRGDAQAQYVMAARTIDGVGVPRNMTDATLWLGRAAEQGHAEAQAVLGDLLVRAAESSKGEKSGDYRIEATKRYVLAAIQGRTGLDDKLRLNKSRMSDSDLAEAERRTRAWRAVVTAPPKTGRTVISPASAPATTPAESSVVAPQRQ